MILLPGTAGKDCAARCEIDASGPCGAFLSCLGKKGSKEADIGEALVMRVCAPSAPSPYVPLPRALGAGSTGRQCGYEENNIWIFSKNTIDFERM